MKGRKPHRRRLSSPGLCMLTKISKGVMSSGASIAGGEGSMPCPTPIFQFEPETQASIRPIKTNAANRSRPSINFFPIQRPRTALRYRCKSSTPGKTGRALDAKKFPLIAQARVENHGEYASRVAKSDWKWNAEQPNSRQACAV